jgi:hypothetical protein
MSAGRARPVTAARTTIGSLLDEAERRLEKREVEFPDASALWLLASVLDRLDDPDTLIPDRRRSVSAEAAARFMELVARRERHEPFQ